MAYIKYKELTKYFNFYKELEIETLPKYVLDYVNKDNEKILKAYATAKDRSVFTTKRMILFDIAPFTSAKKIFVIPYKYITIYSIQFNNDNATLLMYINGSKPLEIKFRNLDSSGKTRLRELFTYMSDFSSGFIN